MAIRMYNRNSAVLVGALLGGALLMHSCANDFDFEKARGEGDPQYEYKVNFESAFGAIDPNQNWDFTDGPTLTRSAGTPSVDIIDGLKFNFQYPNNYDNAIKEYKSIDVKGDNADLYKDISAQLPDCKQQKGEQVILVAPSNSFVIYPVTAQGRYLNHFRVKVGDLEPVTIFEKDWDYKYAPCSNGMKLPQWWCKDKKKDEYICKMPGVRINAPVGTTVQLYLDVINADRNDKNTASGHVEYRVSTGSKNAIYVDSKARPDGLSKDIMPDNAEVKYIGFEDKPKEENYGDKDYNDLTLCVIGNPDVPKDIIIKEKTAEFSTTETKRYMVEDLGAVGVADIDFNDIVIDFDEEKTVVKSFTYENGLLKAEKIVSETYSQTATVRALGGTLDLAVCLKNADGSETPIFKKGGKPLTGVTLNSEYNHGGITIGSSLNVATMYNTGAYQQAGGEDAWDPDYTNWIAKIDLGSGLSYGQRKWRPGENNIVVKVTCRDETESVMSFPELGTVPYMVAVSKSKEDDTIQPWNYERVSVFSKQGEFGAKFIIDRTSAAK